MSTSKKKNEFRNFKVLLTVSELRRFIKRLTGESEHTDQEIYEAIITFKSKSHNLKAGNISGHLIAQFFIKLYGHLYALNKNSSRRVVKFLRELQLDFPDVETEVLLTAFIKFIKSRYKGKTKRLPQVISSVNKTAFVEYYKYSRKYSKAIDYLQTQDVIVDHDSQGVELVKKIIQLSKEFGIPKADKLFLNIVSEFITNEYQGKAYYFTRYCSVANFMQYVEEENKKRYYSILKQAQGD